MKISKNCSRDSFRCKSLKLFNQKSKAELSNSLLDLAENSPKKFLKPFQTTNVTFPTDSTHKYLQLFTITNASENLQIIDSKHELQLIDLITRTKKSVIKSCENLFYIFSAQINQKSFKLRFDSLFPNFFFWSASFFCLFASKFSWASFWIIFRVIRRKLFRNYFFLGFVRGLMDTC